MIPRCATVEDIEYAAAHGHWVLIGRQGEHEETILGSLASRDEDNQVKSELNDWTERLGDKAIEYSLGQVLPLSTAKEVA